MDKKDKAKKFTYSDRVCKVQFRCSELTFKKLTDYCHKHKRSKTSVAGEAVLRFLNEEGKD